MALSCIQQPGLLELVRAAIFLTARQPVLPVRSLAALAFALTRHPDCPLAAVECEDERGRELLFLADPADLDGAECLYLPLRTTQVLSATRNIFYRRLGIAA